MTAFPMRLRCLECGEPCEQVRDASGDSSRGPKAGDFHICCNCYEIWVYVFSIYGVRLRAPTGDELTQFVETMPPDLVSEIARSRAYYRAGRIS